MPTPTPTPTPTPAATPAAAPVTAAPTPAPVAVTPAAAAPAPTPAAKPTGTDTEAEVFFKQLTTAGMNLNQAKLLVEHLGQLRSDVLAEAALSSGQQLAQRTEHLVNREQFQSLVQRSSQDVIGTRRVVWWWGLAMTTMFLAFLLYVGAR